MLMILCFIYQYILKKYSVVKIVNVFGFVVVLMVIFFQPFVSQTTLVLVPHPRPSSCLCILTLAGMTTVSQSSPLLRPPPFHLEVVAEPQLHPTVLDAGASPGTLQNPGLLR